MKQLQFTIILVIAGLSVFSQPKHVASLHASGQFAYTVNDITLGNNPWGMGLGMQLYLRSQKKLKPLVQVSGTAYIMDDKILRLHGDGSPIDDIDELVNVFAGASYHPFPKFFGSIAMGPSFINGDMRFGIQPSIGYFFSNKQRLFLGLSYLQVFNRDKVTGSDFGSFNVSFGVRIF